MNILGISAYYHDSAAALLQNGRITAAAQEERFSRIKHDASFPLHAIKYCLDESGLDLTGLDAIVFYDKPLLKFERLLETYYLYAPQGVTSFSAAIPVWLKEKLFIKHTLKKSLEEIGIPSKYKIPLLFAEHHLSHAASAFFCSPFQEAAILTIDGVGEWATASIGFGQNNQITLLKEMHFPDSLGLLYSSFTYYLGFKVNSGEYKVMGLAPYGKDGKNVSRYMDIIKTSLVSVHKDGSLSLHQDYFTYATGLRMVPDKKWSQLFGFRRRKPEEPLLQHHCELAYAIQAVTEEAVLKMAEEAQRLTGSEYLCLAGGVALNCVANGKIKETGIFRDIYIQPAAGDAGGALGAAYAVHHIAKEQPRETVLPDTMEGAYLGPEFTDKDIQRAAGRFKAPYKKFDSQQELLDHTAGLISSGNVVGWFQGRMEFGPRALGNRSILADPRNPEMQKKLNLKIKFREGFRPFAPAVLEEDASSFFQVDSPSPYMLLVAGVKEDKRNSLPENYTSLPLREKLYTLRSEIPAVTHVDFSARIQTVHKQSNPLFWSLLKSFKEKTGVGLVVNTSFNVRGEPIVCSPADALNCFFKTEMDYLVMGNHVFDKKQQDKNILEKYADFEIQPD